LATRVRRAEIGDLPGLAPLFDGYRRFYGQSGDLEASGAFLADRVERRESILLIAEEGSTPLGFSQLYPAFSSVRLELTYILNDLFVASEARGQGVASALLDASEEAAREEGAASLTLSTARDNMPAQSLYQKAGWRQDERFLTFTKAL
jgi:ribosomal protein S18 acetylase RimI-like enzyme